MCSMKRSECFTLDNDERVAFVGNLSGQITVVDIDTFEVLHETQAHVGVVHAIAVHPTQPYLASIGNDRCLALWRIDKEYRLQRFAYTTFRDVPCMNDTDSVEPIFSHSVALAFHDLERRLATRTGNGGVMELSFEDSGRIDLLWSLRLHEGWDVQMVRYEVGGDRVLSGGRDGGVAMIDHGEVVRHWQFGDVVAHWLEHIAGDTYLLASDLGLVAKFRLGSDDSPRYGSRFARDDMELVTYNRGSNRAFATSFDRNVYEIDVDSCEATRVVYSPGYKCIWAKTLERDPDILLVLCRDGGLHKVSIASGQLLALRKQAPDALWTALTLPNGDVIAAGETGDLSVFRYRGIDTASRGHTFTRERRSTSMSASSYTKRLARDPSTGILAFARNDGEIWIERGDRLSLLTNLGCAVRDIALAKNGEFLFAATENGQILRIETATGRKLAQFQTGGEPFARAVWALAYNPVRDLIAAAEFGKSLHVLDAETLTVRITIECDRVKRIRWVNSDSFLFGSSDAVHRYDLGTPKPVALVTGMQNTIEDFIWDNRRQYLLAVSYQSTIGLFDFATGERLDNVRDQIDYPLGLAWLDSTISPDAYPWNFVTWGRSGTLNMYRVHNERIVAIGPVAPPNFDSQPLLAGKSDSCIAAV